MKYPAFKIAILLMIAASMSACAMSYQPVPPFTPVRVDADGYALKTQNVLVIMDASFSMDEGYQQWKKFDLATAVVRNLAETVNRRVQFTKVDYAFDHHVRLQRPMDRVEASMDPVLNNLKDYVLCIKHNLNAQAVSSLREEVADIEMEVSSLIADMNRCIKEADTFVKTI